LAKFHENIFSLSENIAKSFRWGGYLFDSHSHNKAFQYHVGLFHFREAIPRCGGLAWFAPALSDFRRRK